MIYCTILICLSIIIITLDEQNRGVGKSKEDEAGIVRFSRIAGIRESYLYTRSKRNKLAKQGVTWYQK